MADTIVLHVLRSQDCALQQLTEYCRDGHASYTIIDLAYLCAQNRCSGPGVLLIQDRHASKNLTTFSCGVYLTQQLQMSAESKHIAVLTQPTNTGQLGQELPT